MNKLINKDKFEPWLIDTGSIQDDHYAKVGKNNDKYYRTVGNLEIDINFLRKQNFDFVIFLIIICHAIISFYQDLSLVIKLVLLGAIL